MATKVDASSWTGLKPERRFGDVRGAQRPVAGGPRALEAREYAHRLFNWPSLLFLLPIWLAISLTSDGGLVRAAWLAGVYVLLFVAISLFVGWRRGRNGTSIVLRMDKGGLHLPREYVEPVPWLRVGKVEYANGRFVGLIRIAIDPAHKLVLRPPWPFNAGKGASVDMDQPCILLSTWNIDADGDALIAELEQFRDNYCVEGARQ